MRRMNLIVPALVLGPMLVGSTLSAQQPENPVVHVSQYQISWNRVDSLSTLWAMYPEWLPKAQELGHIIDRQLWVHRQGDEWNVVIVSVYPSWKSWATPEPGWGAATFRSVEPDSTARAAYNEGMNWVFEGSIHKDNIYRLVK